LAGTGQHFYRVQGPLIQDWQPNLFVYQTEQNGVEAIVRSIGTTTVRVLQLARDYRASDTMCGASLRAIASKILRSTY